MFLLFLLLLGACSAACVLACLASFPASEWSRPRRAFPGRAGNLRNRRWCAFVRGMSGGAALSETSRVGRDCPKSEGRGPPPSSGRTWPHGTRTWMRIGPGLSPHNHLLLVNAVRVDPLGTARLDTSASRSARCTECRPNLNCVGPGPAGIVDPPAANGWPGRPVKLRTSRVGPGAGKLATYRRSWVGRTSSNRRPSSVVPRGRQLSVACRESSVVSRRSTVGRSSVVLVWGRSWPTPIWECRRAQNPERTTRSNVWATPGPERAGRKPKTSNVGTARHDGAAPDDIPKPVASLLGGLRAADWGALGLVPKWARTARSRMRPAQVPGV